MKKLRFGYTTGACAAAAAKGATLALLNCGELKEVEIPFPDGSRVRFVLSRFEHVGFPASSGLASVIKDAGDDPDVTNGAEIEAYVCLQDDATYEERIQLVGGRGVGVVTKPGLSVDVGMPAINPIPRKMIIEAVTEALIDAGDKSSNRYRVTISIPEGEKLAQKTLNKRLGVLGGLSILGTTGIVRPISAEAWTATIVTSMNVAVKAGVEEIVLSTGRTSEKSVQQGFSFTEEALVMMGDYLEFSLQEAGRHQFLRIHMAGMWAKVLKGAMEIPQTHVRNGALEVDSAIEFLDELFSGQNLASLLSGANTAREIYARLISASRLDIVASVCRKARGYCEKTSGLPVTVHLVDATGKIVLSV